MQYIQSSGGDQCVNTLVCLQPNIDFEIKLQFTNISSEKYIFGTSDISARVGIVPRNGTTKFTTCLNSVWGGEVGSVAVNTDYTFVGSYGSNSQNVKVNGTQIASWGQTLSTTNKPLMLFGGSGANGANVKLYYCKMRTNGALQRYFIPCYRKSDNVIGLYDLVTETFFTNSGTGTFTKGPNVD